MWIYGPQVWGGYGKKSNIIKDRAFKNILLRKFTNVPSNISNIIPFIMTLTLKLYRKRLYVFRIDLVPKSSIIPTLFNT